MPIKVAFIGAGSVGFTRRLCRDILSVPELRDTDFSFTDISKRNLDMVAQLVRKDIKGNGMHARLRSTVNRRRALEGADYVINCSRIGGSRKPARRCGIHPPAQWCSTRSGECFARWCVPPPSSPF